MLNYSRWTVWASIAFCLICFMVALPNALPQAWRDAMPGWLPKSTMNLGLDLQGGSYLLLEVDVNTMYRDKLDSMRDDIRVKLRQANIGYTGLSVQPPDKVVVKLRDPSQTSQANDILKGMVASVEGGLLGGGAQNYDLTSTPDGTFTFTMTEGARTYFEQQTLSQSIEIVRRRIDELGTKEPTIQKQGEDRILVQVPGLSDPQRLKEILGKTAKLQFRFVDEGGDIEGALQGRVPPGDDLLYETQQGQKIPYLIEKRVIISGDELTNAQQGFDGRNGQAVVNFQFNAAGARKFGDATKEGVGRRFAIVLDNAVVSAPRIQEPIMAGSGQITGNFTVQSANDLSIVLRAGALPAPLSVVEERTVGSELGADSIQKGTLSALIGILAVLVLMIACYGLFGFFAIVGLAMNLIITVAAMTFLGATMTLPGIAGLILSIGITVDANVLFYERMREERDNGKQVVSSLANGYSGALPAIIDANMAHLIACVILFQLGSGPIRGFAVTLGIGVLVSWFTAILLTRLMIVSWYRWRRPRALPL